jgi:hypothetical protein
VGRPAGRHPWRRRCGDPPHRTTTGRDRRPTGGRAVNATTRPAARPAARPRRGDRGRSEPPDSHPRALTGDERNRIDGLCRPRCGRRRPLRTTERLLTAMAHHGRPDPARAPGVAGTAPRARPRPEHAAGPTRAVVRTPAGPGARGRTGEWSSGESRTVINLANRAPDVPGSDAAPPSVAHPGRPPPWAGNVRLLTAMSQVVTRFSPKPGDTALPRWAPVGPLLGRPSLRGTS